MPTYDYQCRNCGHELEIFQSIKEAPKKKCPKCGKLTLKRLLGTGAGVIFKGSGFYQTDYRSEGYRKAAEKEKPSAAAKTDKKEIKADTKSEAKTESKPNSAMGKKKKAP